MEKMPALKSHRCSLRHFPYTHVVEDVGVITGDDVIKYYGVTRHAQGLRVVVFSILHFTHLTIRYVGIND